jgi:hypothetical protein
MPSNSLGFVELATEGDCFAQSLSSQKFPSLPNFLKGHQFSHEYLREKNKDADDMGV